LPFLLQFIQKRDPKYAEVKDETAWSMDRFNDYVNENIAPNKRLPRNWVYGHLDVSITLASNSIKQTKRRRHRRQESNLVHFSPEIWRLVAIF